MNQSKLKEILEDRGIKQRKLAEKTGFHFGTISNYVLEKTIPNVYNAVKIAKFLNLPVEDIFLIK